MAVIAIDLGGTKMASAITDESGTLKFVHKNLLLGRKGHEVGKLVVEGISRQLDKATYHKIQIDSIGICVPGSINQENGRVWAPNIPEWNNYPLANVVTSLLGNQDIKVYVDNDRSCSVYGELWQGAARGCKNVVFMAVGTGIGAGIIVDGHSLHGASDIIGATGWMALQSPFVPEYGPQGCFEYFASGEGIRNRAKDKVRNDKSYRGILRQMPTSRLSTHSVFQAFENDDPIARQVVQKAIELWGMAAANFVSLLNPEKIIWGGGVFGPAAALIDEIFAESVKWAQPLSMRIVKYAATQLRGNAGILGAGFLALNHGDVRL